MTHNYFNSIADQRVKNQFIKGSGLTSAHEVVKMMGAIQAQDFNMARWALGIRSRNLTLEKINKDIDEGKIIRIHLLRPTWQFVSPEDVYWLLDLSATSIVRALRYRDKELGLTSSIFNKCNYTIENG